MKQILSVHGMEMPLLALVGLVTINATINGMFILLYTAIQCTTLSAIDNGTISYNPTGNGQFGFNTVATHTCTMGYFLSSGCNVRMCGGDDSSTTGMWSGNVPMCTGESLLLVYTHMCSSRL